MQTLNIEITSKTGDHTPTLEHIQKLVAEGYREGFDESENERFRFQISE